MSLVVISDDNNRKNWNKYLKQVIWFIDGVMRVCDYFDLNIDKYRV